MSEKKARQLWFLRRNQDVRGPFPTAVISQYLLLGRLHKHDEVSLDQHEWHAIGDVDELMPEVMKADLSEPVHESNLEATRRGNDERGVEDRRHTQDAVDAEHRLDDRRAEETPEAIAERQARIRRKLEQAEAEARSQNRMLAIVLVVICVGILGLIFGYNPENGVPDIDCEAKPASGVNWSNCNFQGAALDGAVIDHSFMRSVNMSNVSLYRANLQETDMAYANLGVANLRLSNLRGVVLVGANLRGADLRGADLSGAILSYANLEGAQLTGAKLDGAKLDKTIWVNGEQCMLGSLGQCLALQ